MNVVVWKKVEHKLIQEAEKEVLRADSLAKRSEKNRPLPNQNPLLNSQEIQTLTNSTPDHSERYD